MYLMENMIQPSELSRRESEEEDRHPANAEPSPLEQAGVIASRAQHRTPASSCLPLD
jgi:hypothetical protein